MDRNLLIAFVLSFLVLYTWSSWQETIRPPEPPAGIEQLADPSAPTADPLSPGTEPAAPQRSLYTDLPEGDPAPEGLPARVASLNPPDPGSLITIDRPLFEAVLTSRGGALYSWKLKDYTDEFGERVALVEGEGGPGPAASTPFPGLRLGDLSNANWRIESQDLNEITFAFEDKGVSIRKTWIFDDDTGYGFRLRLEVENGSNAAISPRFLVDWPARARDEQDFVEQMFALLQAGEVEQTPLAGLGSAGFFGSLTGSQPKQHYDFGGPKGPIEWAGVQTTYFVSALLPDDPNQALARIDVLEPSERGVLAVYYDAVELPPGQSLTRELRGYVGPKEMDRLAAVGGGIDRSIDLGWSWFEPMTRGFVWMLHVLYSFIPNYGVAIILLTIMVRVVTAPLTVKQMKSMERLRRVQPQMKEIQEKHKDDKQKQSEAMMRLYKTEKVNPLGGCFPMLLQLPVFIGLFYSLRSSIQLRQSPFFGWIDDLSAPEALFTIPGIEIPVRVLPLIMGATMFLQQKITPMQTPDPAQARMMQTIMPLMMTVLFYQFASGLVLYWMVSNVLAISHQLWIGRNMDKPGAARSENPEPKATWFRRRFSKGLRRE